MKTKSFLAITLIFSSLLIFTGCRKGEDDPFLSLRSRTARLTGEWKLTSGEINYTYNSSGSIATTIETYSESSVTISYSGGSSYTDNYSYNLTFDKKGTYKSDLEQGGYNETKDGRWHWVGRNRDGDLRNKEAIIMTALTLTDNEDGTETYGGSSIIPDILYRIKQLKNKELVLIVDESYTSSLGDFSSSSVGTLTFEKQ